MEDVADVLSIWFARGTSQAADHSDRNPRHDWGAHGGLRCRTSRCNALPTGPPMVRSASDSAHAMAKRNLENSGEFASVTALLAADQAINPPARFGARLEPLQSYLQGSAAGNLQLAPPIADCCACHGASGAGKHPAREAAPYAPRRRIETQSIVKMLTCFQRASICSAARA